MYFQIVPYHSLSRFRNLNNHFHIALAAQIQAAQAQVAAQQRMLQSGGTPGAALMGGGPMMNAMMGMPTSMGLQTRSARGSDPAHVVRNWILKACLTLRVPPPLPRHTRSLHSTAPPGLNQPPCSMMGGRGMGMPTTVMSMPNMSSMTSSMR